MRGSAIGRLGPLPCRMYTNLPYLSFGVHHYVKQSDYSMQDLHCYHMMYLLNYGKIQTLTEKTELANNVI